MREAQRGFKSLNTINRARARKSLLLASATVVLGYSAAAYAQAPAASQAPEVEQVVVTGTRLTAAGFTAPTPVTVLGQEAIQKRSPASTAEVVNELPAFKVSASPSTNTRVVGGSGQIQPNLRGLGASRTLTLINGRRYTPSSTGFTADMATIPSSLIDRVDVVTGGASAAYGSDAVAGVLNFVINNRLNGIKGNIQGGSSQQGDQRELTFGIGAGGSFINDRLHVSIGGDFSRDWGAGNWYSRDYYAKNEYGLIANGATRSATTPANSWVANVETIQTPGSIIASGPLKGTAFTLAGDPYAFQYGTVFGSNQVGVNSNYGHNALLIQQLRHPFERHDQMLMADFDVTDHMQVFFEMNRAFTTNGGGGFGDTLQSTGIIINGTNPFIPASVKARMTALGLTNIVLGRFNDDVTPWYQKTTWKTNREVLGVRGDVDFMEKNWKYEAYYQQGHTNHSQRQDPMLDLANFYGALNVVADANGNAVCGNPATNPNFPANAPLVIGTAAKNMSPGCVPFNVFGQKNSPAAIDYVTGEDKNLNRIDQDLWGVSVSGAPFTLPAGDVSLAFGAEGRSESVYAEGDPRGKIQAWQTLQPSTYTGSNSVKEAFAELGVPVLKDVTFAKSLDLNGAIRRTDYKNSGAVTTWKIGATYEPTDFLRLRGTKSRDIRAPNISELFSPGGAGGGSNGIRNPFNNQVGRTATGGGGNPNLTPEVADTLTGGIVFSPHWGLLESFRLSVDYYNIKISNGIGTIATQDMIDRCYGGETALCQFVQRDNTLFGIALVLSNQLNFATQEAEGFDFEIAYRVPLNALPFNVPGSLTLRNLTNNVTKLSRSDGKKNIDSSGYSSGMNKLTGQATADYELGPFNIGLQARYFGDFRLDVGQVGPDDPHYKPTLSNSVNINRAPGQVLFNLNASYDLVNREGRTLTLYTTVNNVFNREPAIIPSIALNNLANQYYDIIGRMFRAGVRFKF